MEHDIADDNDDDDNFVEIQAQINSKYEEEKVGDNSDFVTSYVAEILECKKAVELSTFNSTWRTSSLI